MIPNEANRRVFEIKGLGNQKKVEFVSHQDNSINDNNKQGREKRQVEERKDSDNKMSITGDDNLVFQDNKELGNKMDGMN